MATIKAHVITEQGEKGVFFDCQAGPGVFVADVLTRKEAIALVELLIELYYLNIGVETVQRVTVL